MMSGGFAPQRAVFFAGLRAVTQAPSLVQVEQRDFARRLKQEKNHYVKLKLKEGFSGKVISSKWRPSQKSKKAKTSAEASEKQKLKLKTRTREMSRLLQTDSSVSLSRMILKSSPAQLKKRSQELEKLYGFSKQEVKYIARQKPDFLFYNKDKDMGIEALHRLFVEKMSFTPELLRTLVLKHPPILGRSVALLESKFAFMKNKGVSEYDTMKYFFEIPLLMTTDIFKSAKEIEELFALYHGIQAAQVTEIFRAFPYLYCCPSRKVQLFLCEFRKYRLDADQIMNLVSSRLFAFKRSC